MNDLEKKFLEYYLGVGGGAVVVPVFYNGTAWVSA